MGDQAGATTAECRAARAALGEIGPGDGSPDEHLDDHPGSVVLEIDQERRLAYVHVLDVGSPKAVASFYAQLRQLERLFISAFERDVDWHPDTDPLRESDTREEV
ncbi:na+/H+ ion antiporter subunit [Mycobacteroides abscessus MAB_082312_2258]|nr:na+/H+ ion antiporter subunit [Mycobacteroides abscessus MAB_082312_2258]